MATSWLRQFQVLTTKNRRILLRRPIHLLILLLSSVISVVLAFFAGRDLRGPTGEFPPLTDCGVVDPMYLMLDLKWEDLTYEERYNIPKSLNESWRGGLPIWILSLGPSLAAISAFLIIREELVSKRWGMLKSADLSTQWLSWSFSFFVCGIINSLAGGTTAAVMPNIHAFESVNFALVFGSLLFLNMALVACSFFLAALCGTIQSTTLTVFLIMGMIVAGSVPAIAASSTNFATYSASLNTYSHPTGAGSFWEYGSTERIMVEYGYEDNYDDLTGEYINTTTTNEMTQCEVPLVSYEQGHLYKTSAERDAVPASDIFEGCYVIAGSQARFGSNNFFWYMIPQTHFLAAWSNILGYTGLPGNVFSIDKANMSPEELSFEALANFKGGKSYDQSNTNNRTSLFAQGSTILPDVYYDWTQYNYNYDSMEETKSTCPSSGLSNLCSDYATECYFPRAGFPSSGSPSFNDDLGYMLSLVIIYSIVAAYFSAVFPMSNGARSKFYFPFQRKFWCSNRRWNGGNEDDAVEASGVSKKYGKVEALKPFSLKMKSSQLTALLGHNGAGKSTFVNLLCCEQNATSGDINVMGVPLSDQYAIRKMIGECKQDDILWPNLSAKEHLELFAGLRGVSQDEIADTVQEWLESVDLESVQNTRVSSFSGGMKRRLSVAMSTIGDSKLIVLDEPTTGMDPVSRRFVWNHISAIKKGRVILLTTHAMEEADLLADNVAIMCNGELAAFGSPLDLKTQHGSALQLSIICEKEDVIAVEDYVKRAFGESLSYVEFESSTSGYCTLTIRKVYKAAVGQAVYDKDGGREGVSITDLSSFIGWCEDETSPVQGENRSWFATAV